MATKTEPANTIKKGNSRFYVWPPVGVGTRELEVPSVTTIINGGVPKDALKFWAANTVADFAIDHKTTWENLPRDAAYDLLRREPLRFTEKRSDEGSAVHHALQAYSDGRETLLTDPELQQQYTGALAFLSDCEVEVIYSEATVYSRKHQYAGSADLFANVLAPGWTEPRLCIVDYKTSKAIYPEGSIQLAAYSRADFVAVNGKECQMPGKIRDGFIVRPTREGGYEAQHFHLTDALFRLFLAAKVVQKRNVVFGESKGLNFGAGA